MDVMVMMLGMALAGEKWGINRVGYLAYGLLTAVFLTMMGMLFFAFISFH